MHVPSTLSSGRSGLGEAGSLREIWVFLLGMGIALMVLGMAAIGSSLIATFAAVLVFGILLLLGAFFQFVTALWGRNGRGCFLYLLAAGLLVVAGAVILL